MSDVERPTDATPDTNRTPIEFSDDQAAYPGDPALNRPGDGPDDPAGVQEPQEPPEDSPAMNT